MTKGNMSIFSAAERKTDNAFRKKKNYNQIKVFFLPSFFPCRPNFSHAGQKDTADFYNNKDYAFLNVGHKN